MAKPQIDVLEHIEWANAIARRVAFRYRVRSWSPDVLDLEQTAQVALLETLNRVSARVESVDHFRALAHDTIYFVCRHELLRMRTGGTHLRPKVDTPFPHHMFSDPDDVFDQLLVTDGRRAAPPQPLDRMVQLEELRRVPDVLAPDLLLALALTADFPRPLVANRWDTAPPDRVHWVRLLKQHGYTHDKIARVLRIARATVQRDLGGKHRASRAKPKKEAARAKANAA